MDIQELVKRVRKIELKSKMLSEQIFSGEYHTAFKGRGMQFSEVRAYSYGDDVRHIEWNVSARMQTPYVKLFEEEREQTILILADVSASVFTSLAPIDRKDFLAEIIATIAFAAAGNQDKIGLLLFDQQVRNYIPPAKGTKQVLQLLRTVLQTEPEQNQSTNIAAATDYLRKVHKRPAVIFLLSDFLQNNYKEAVKSLSKKNDLIGIALKDPLDEMLPDIGLIQVTDAETGEQMWVDTGDISYQQWYKRQAAEQKAFFDTVFKEARADAIRLRNDEDYIKALQIFFRKRAAKR